MVKTGVAPQAIFLATWVFNKSTLIKSSIIPPVKIHGPLSEFSDQTKMGHPWPVLSKILDLIFTSQHLHPLPMIIVANFSQIWTTGLWEK